MSNSLNPDETRYFVGRDGSKLFEKTLVGKELFWFVYQSISSVICYQTLIQ